MKFFAKDIILEETAHVIPPTQVDEISGMYEATLKTLENDLQVPKDVLNSFQIKDILNPEIWDNLKLNPKIRKELFKIAKDFFDSLKLPAEIKIKDILFVGSLANFNWSKYSDIDLHLLLDFSQIEMRDDFVKKYFDAEKNLWNEKHDISVKGYPVEIYVQDTKEKNAATAVYSIPFDKWLLKPEKEKFKLDKQEIKLKVSRYFQKLKDIRDFYNKDEYQKVVKRIDDLKETIKAMRKAGLERGGEFSTENIVFKILRRTDFIELLDIYKTKAYDKLVTVNENQP